MPDGVEGEAVSVQQKANEQLWLLLECDERGEADPVIARLEGTLVEKHPTRVVLDVAGVGYEIFIPVTTFYELPEAGESLLVHFNQDNDLVGKHLMS